MAFPMVNTMYVSSPLFLSGHSEADEPLLLTEDDVLVTDHQQTALHISSQTLDDPIVT